MIDYAAAKKYISRIAGILAGLLIFTTISDVLDKMYVEVDSIAWYRILWHHFYEDEGKIDNLYLGSSHVFCDLDPSILGRLNGQYNFNLSSGSQPLNGSYYLLREADQRNKLHHVYLEMYYACSYDSMLYNYWANWFNVDYMEPSFNRAAYLTKILGADKAVELLLPFSRYRTQLGDWKYVQAQLSARSGEDYRNYRYMKYDDNGKLITVYDKQGYREDFGVYEDDEKLFQQQHILSSYSMGKESEAYCRRIIEYCREREIPITLYVAPIYELQLISTLDYDDYSTAIRALASEYDIPFYDFNLARREYLPMQDGKEFYDVGHLNQNGAELFTPFFYQVTSGEEDDNEKYFYNSYKGKLQDEEPAIYGIYYRSPEEDAAEPGEQMKTMWVASNRESGMEYKIILTPEEGEPYLVQDFSENKEFSVPQEESGVCTLAARMAGSMENLQTMEINY